MSKRENPPLASAEAPLPPRVTPGPLGGAVGGAGGWVGAWWHFWGGLSAAEWLYRRKRRVMVCVLRCALSGSPKERQ